MGKAYFCSVEAPEASVAEKGGVMAMCIVCKSTAWQNSDYFSDFSPKHELAGGRRKKDNIKLIDTWNSYVQNACLASHFSSTISRTALLELHIFMCPNIWFASSFQGLINEVKRRINLFIWRVKDFESKWVCLHDTLQFLARNVQARYAYAFV